MPPHRFHVFLARAVRTGFGQIIKQNVGFAVPRSEPLGAA